MYSEIVLHNSLLKEYLVETRIPIFHYLANNFSKDIEIYIIYFFNYDFIFK